MRITDALRGETATLLEVVSFARRAFGAEGGAKLLEGLLVELLDSHRRRLEPLIQALEARLGPSGLMLVVRCEQARLERELRELGRLSGFPGSAARERLGARCADLLAIELALLFPLADAALPEEHLQALGDGGDAER